MLEKIQNWAKDLKHQVLVLWFALKNPQTPLLPRVVAFITVAYALSPIDLIPDFIPVLGYLDDLIIVPVLIWMTLKLVPEKVLCFSHQQAQEWFKSNQLKPKIYFGLMIVLAIWFLIVWLVYTHIKDKI